MKKIKRMLSAAISLLITISCIIAPAYAKGFEKGDPDTFFAPVFQDYGKFNFVPDQYFLTLADLESTGVANCAEAAAEALDKMPPGRRILQLDPKIGMTMKNDLEVGFFVQESKVEYTKSLMEGFFKELSEEYGSQIDIMFDDDENWPSPYYIENEAIAAFRQPGEEIYDSIALHGHLYNDYIKKELLSIEKSPKYSTQLKPLLEKIGFVFGPNYDLEYINIHAGALEPRRTMFYESNPPEGATESFNKFTAAITELAEEKYREAILEPALKYYPNLKHSNFADATVTGKILRYDNYGNKVSDGKGSGKDDSIVGTHSNVVTYGDTGTRLETYPPAEWRFETYRDTPFQALRKASVNLTDATAGTEDSKLTVWITRKKVGFDNTDYYNEQIFHAGLHNPDPFLFWTGVYDNLGDDMEHLGKLFAHLGEMVGHEDRETLMTEPEYAPTMHQRYVLTGMRVNDYHVWRITPDLYVPGVTKENFCIDKDTPTFQIGNQFVKFPEGSYIYEPDNDLCGYGYWVISPLGTRPEEWRDANTPMPAQAVWTKGELPEGYKYPAGTEMPDELDLSESKKKVETKPAQKDNTEDNDNAEVEVNVKTLKLNPIKGGGAKTQLFSGTLPKDAVGHWAEHTMANMFGLGIMNGTEKGMEPDNYVNKAEFLAMLQRILGAETVAYGGEISDISADAWYADVMQTALTGGWTELDDISYKAEPEALITRGEMCAVIAKALSLETDGTETAFADNMQISPSQRGYVAAVAETGLIAGYSDGTFKAGGILTRAETAVVFERLLGIIPNLFG